jgi:transposase
MSEVTVQTERVDDIPLLIKQQQEMGIGEVIDRWVPRHGNGKGLSLGWMTVGWLAYILSQSGHRLSYVEGWAAERLTTLKGTIPGPVEAKDLPKGHAVSDDRLGDALGQMSDDEVWQQIEDELNQRVIRVYALPTETMRVDSTTVARYHDEEESELIAYGPSKDHRPDLAQVKVLLNTLDPLALPIVTLIVSGNQTDDDLYIPAIEKAQGFLLSKGLLYVGDSKMEALETRAYLVQGGNTYLVPLSQKGEKGALLDQQVAHVLAQEPDLVAVYSGNGDEVEDFLQVDYHQQEVERQIRAYKNRPARKETRVRYQLVGSRKEAAIETV